MLVLEEKRERAFDIVKGFAMLCILAGHFSDGFVCRFVFTFHVPIFFLIGGYFFKANRSRLKARILRLLKPYLFTVLAVAFLDTLKQLVISFHRGLKPDYLEIEKKILNWLLAGLYGSGSRKDLFSLTMPVIGAIWFLLAFIWVILFMELLQSGSESLPAQRRSIIQPVAVLGLFFLGFYSAKIVWLPFSIQSGCVSFLFFMVGYRVKQNLPSLIQHKAVLSAAILIWGIAVFFSVRHDYMSLVRCAFPDALINIAGACAAALVLLAGAGVLDNRKRLTSLCLFLEWIGQNTLPFLCFHLMELNVFPWRSLVRHFGINYSSVTPVVFCLKLCWCLFGVYATRKLILLRHIFQ